MANQCKEHNVENYIQWVTTLSLTMYVFPTVFEICSKIAGFAHPLFDAT